MRPALNVLACASVLAFTTGVGSSQVNAADDASAPVANQIVADNADVPKLTDSADAAFRKLDRGAKGYVTYDDVSSLSDFASDFGNADSTHLGRLNLAGFTKAWAAYAKRGN
ncbi:MAG TPA: hypothetical protein VHB46_01760 [Burkholderiales bacterium]|nr:hypothetical protein [Burkholderiales bacterium]